MGGGGEGGRDWGKGWGGRDWGGKGFKAADSHKSTRARTRPRPSEPPSPPLFHPLPAPPLPHPSNHGGWPIARRPDRPNDGKPHHRRRLGHQLVCRSNRRAPQPRLKRPQRHHRREHGTCERERPGGQGVVGRSTGLRCRWACKRSAGATGAGFATEATSAQRLVIAPLGRLKGQGMARCALAADTLPQHYVFILPSRKGW